MTQEELKALQRTKEDISFLISELCQRMPYGIKLHKCKEDDTIYQLYSINLDSNEIRFWTYQGKALRIGDIDKIHRFGIIRYKPYLFPMSAMTEAIKDEIYQETGLYDIFEDNQIHIEVGTNFADVCKLFNILNKYHLDYNGLIPKDLAIDATGLNIY